MQSVDTIIKCECKCGANWYNTVKLLTIRKVISTYNNRFSSTAISVSTWYVDSIESHRKYDNYYYSVNFNLNTYKVRRIWLNCILPLAKLFAWQRTSVVVLYSYTKPNVINSDCLNQGFANSRRNPLA